MNVGLALVPWYTRSWSAEVPMLIEPPVLKSARCRTVPTGTSAEAVKGVRAVRPHAEAGEHFAQRWMWGAYASSDDPEVAKDPAEAAAWLRRAWRTGTEEQRNWLWKAVLDGRHEYAAGELQLYREARAAALDELGVAQ